MNARSLYLFAGLLAVISLMVGCLEPDSPDPFSIEFEGVLGNPDPPYPPSGTASVLLDFTGAVPLQPGKCPCVGVTFQVNIEEGWSWSFLWLPEGAEDYRLDTIISNTFPIGYIGQPVILQQTLADDIVPGLPLNTNMDDDEASGIALFGEVTEVQGEVVVLFYCTSNHDDGNGSTITYNEYTGIIHDPVSATSTGFADNGYEDWCTSSSKAEATLLYKDDLLMELKSSGIIDENIAHIIMFE